MDIKTWIALHSAIEKLAINKSEKSYCHYTTPAAFAGIFKKYIESHMSGAITECTMRASHIRFLNDSKEYLDGLQWMQKKEGHSFESMSDDMYSISFCGEEDLLSQWKWYGKHSGIAISFDMTNIKYSYYKVALNELPDEDMNTKPLPVKYTEADKEDYYRRIVEMCEDSQLNLGSKDFRGNLFIPFCKDESFQEEAESRLIFYDVDGKNVGIKPFEIEYVSSGNILKPTLNVMFRAIDKNKGIVKRLTVGPGQDQDLIYNALIHILGGDIWLHEEIKNPDGYIQQEVNGIIIRKSKIPFRG